MNDVEDQIRRDLVAAADRLGTGPAPVADVVRRGRTLRRRRQQARAAAGGTALGLVAVTGLWVAGDRGEGTVLPAPSVSVAQQPTASPSASSLSSPSATSAVSPTRPTKGASERGVTADPAPSGRATGRGLPSRGGTADGGTGGRPGTAAVGAPQQISWAQARALLADSEVRTYADTDVQAWRWNDANGLNVLVAGLTVYDKDRFGAPTSATLHVTQAVGVGTEGSRAAVRMKEDGGPQFADGTCGADLTLAVQPGSVTLSDRDGDGFGEVTIGWVNACRSDVSRGSAKVALLEDGVKHILRGEGLEVTAPSATNKALVEDLGPLRFTPDPVASSWPADTYRRTAALFRKLFV